MSTKKIAAGATAKIFEDLRDRRFLKWLFAEDPEDFGPILHDNRGEPLLALDRDVQAEIAKAWTAIIQEAVAESADRTAERCIEICRSSRALDEAISAIEAEIAKGE